MIEFFLAIGSGVVMPTFPDSGPGPKTLSRGTEDAGFFGTLTAEELYDRYDLATVLPLTANLVGPNANQTFHWLKFMFKGKVLFIPSLPLYGQTSWNNLYEAGYLYGTGDYGLYPTANPTIQEKRLIKDSVADQRTYAYNVRTMTGAENDPQTSVVSNTLGINEYDTLFGLLPGMPSGEVATQYGMTYNQITKNTGNPNTFMIARMSNGTVGSSSASFITKTATTMYWRPVLELIEPDTVAFGPRDLYSIFDIQKPPFDLSATPIDVAKPPTVVWGTQADMKQPELLTVTSV